MHYDGEAGLGLNREGFYNVVRLGLFNNCYEILERVGVFSTYRKRYSLEIITKKIGKFPINIFLSYMS
jgi:hypothetical protein